MEKEWEVKKEGASKIYTHKTPVEDVWKCPKCNKIYHDKYYDKCLVCLVPLEKVSGYSVENKQPIFNKWVLLIFAVLLLLIFTILIFQIRRSITYRELGQKVKEKTEPKEAPAFIKQEDAVAVAPSAQEKVSKDQPKSYIEWTDAEGKLQRKEFEEGK